MIRWAEPVWLLGLLIPVLLFVVELIRRRSQAKKRTEFASEPLWRILSPARSEKRIRSKFLFLLLGFGFLVLGLANPQVGTRYEKVTRKGVDIFMVVDVSKSMDAQDIRPSRIGKTRYELDQFLEGLKGDRVGIIPFAGTAYPLCPLTLDYSAAAMFIDLLETGLIPTQGTNIAKALEMALELFPYDEGRGRSILLISDGEDHEGNVESLVKEAADKGVIIYTVGMAGSKGDPIPEFDEDGNQVGWKTDKDGHVITSKLNEDLLRGIAAATGGKYVRASQGGAEFQAIYKSLFGLERKEFEEKQITDYEDRFQPFLLLALLFFTLEFVFPAGKRVKL